jgi:hypothetical protein
LNRQARQENLVKTFTCLAVFAVKIYGGGMAKQRIEKTLVVFTEEEVRRILELVRRDDEQEIRQFMLKEFVKKVEYILRRRCG